MQKDLSSNVIKNNKYAKMPEQTTLAFYITKKKRLESRFSLGLFEPFYCGEAAAVEVVVRICPVWWTIRGSK